MAHKLSNISLKKINRNDAMPYALLLLADPSKEMIDGYLKHSAVYVALHQEEIIGVVVLQPVTNKMVEIKNLAVKPDHQGQGVGSFLLLKMIEVAKTEGNINIRIGTANSSVWQLYLYQKFGFEVSEIIYNFFLDNYSEAIYEDGTQAKHMLVLTRQL